MKVGIITLNGIINVGNRLQNYAVQELLKERGCTTSTILYQEFCNSRSFVSKLKIAVFNILSALGITTSKFYLEKIKKSPRKLLFQNFNKKHIDLTKKYFFRTSKMQKYHSDFDYFCAGSDQIWNARFVQNHDYFFMKFAPSEKTFSFSASMGTTEIPEKHLENYREGFSHVGNISVREADMQGLIQEMVGRKTTLLLDPTLLYGKEKWLAISKKPKTDFPKRYIATYFLSDITESQRHYIEKYAKDNQLKIVDILGKYSNYIGPAEFIYTIANADFVFTDSFHGTAFSIIFEKDFMVFQRNRVYDMSSRITTILDTFGLSHRFYNTNNECLDNAFYSLIQTIKSEDHSHIQTILASEKKKLDTFLDAVFSTKN